MEVLMRITICLFCCLAVLSGPAARGGEYLAGFEVPDDATYVGSEDCTMCHDDIGEFYTHSPHAPSRMLSIPGQPEAFGCEACHGPGSLHVDGGGDGWIIGLEQMEALDDQARADMCLQCHTSMDLHWDTGPHAGTEISCADCHGDQVHFGSEATPANAFRNKAEFCLQCHAEVSAAFRLPFRHRVLEGDLSCNDCHDPHRGTDLTTLEGANALCLECHQQMAGPFVFEHHATSTETCTECHLPHGSHNDKLLTQDGNGLCLQCHYEVTFNADDNFELGGVSHNGLLQGEAHCYDCHVEIHGSNVSPTFLDQ
jgi:DmsE family decaheme c-type cytochrome